MSEIWLISDTHFGHNKDFIFSPRKFSSVEEMDAAIIERWNSVVNKDDIVYHLGDFIMGDLTDGLNKIRQLNGKIKLAIGNHDIENRLNEFVRLSNIEDIQFGYRIKEGKKTFLLSHYPQLTGNYDNSKTYSIHGHTHFLTKFWELEDDFHNLMYNVSCEAINCQPLNWIDMKLDIMTKQLERTKEVKNKS